MVEFIIIDLFIILELAKIFDLVIVESLIEDSSTVESTSVEPDASEISSKLYLLFSILLFSYKYLHRKRFPCRK